MIQVIDRGSSIVGGQYDVRRPQRADRNEERPLVSYVAEAFVEETVGSCSSTLFWWRTLPQPRFLLQIKSLSYLMK